METPLAKYGAAFSRNNGLSRSGTMGLTSNFDERGQFQVTECGGFWEYSTALKAFSSAMEENKVFCDG